MKKNDIYKVVITILAIVATLVVILVTASILAPPKRSSKTEYALECEPQYVKLPKEKCEIKEAK